MYNFFLYNYLNDYKNLSNCAMEMRDLVCHHLEFVRDGITKNTVNKE